MSVRTVTFRLVLMLRDSWRKRRQTLEATPHRCSWSNCLKACRRMLSRTARGRQAKAELSDDMVPVSEGEGRDQIRRLPFTYSLPNGCSIALHIRQPRQRQA